jgi:hypothetical protein
MSTDTTASTPEPASAPQGARRGRKPLPPGRRRTIFVGIRLSPEEAAHIHAVAAENHTTVSHLTRLLYKRLGSNPIVLESIACRRVNAGSNGEINQPVGGPNRSSDSR